jgi:predicted lipoprotein with Yx(FWY)xxD motif
MAGRTSSERIVMNHPRQLAYPLRASLLTGIAGAALAAACLGDAPAGITDQTAAAAAGQSPAEGSGATSMGGSTPTAGTPQAHGGSDPTVEGGSGGTMTSGGTSAAAGGLPALGEAGMPPIVAEAGAGGAAGEPDGVHIGHACSFHTDAPAPVEGAAGAGGEAAAPDVLSQVSPFVGNYLTDAAGRTLYTYGADLPGDCQTPPQSTCVADCLVSWPIFEAGARVLGAGLDDAAFGSIQRADGAFQTTYHGWPLYYYKADLTLGQMTGQGKGKIWHIAETSLPSITVMKAGLVKYLADVDGHTLYVSAADQVGTADTEPVSNCEGACLQTFEGFHEKKFSAVTVLEMSDFQVFARHGSGGLQLAYKGMPLYRAATDLKSGDMNGTAVAGFTAALP